MKNLIIHFGTERVEKIVTYDYDEVAVELIQGDVKEGIFKGCMCTHEIRDGIEKM